MKKTVLFFLVFIISKSIFSQWNYTISGYITDESNGESIVGVNIYSKELNLGAISNNYGFYSLTLPKGEHEIFYSFIGYDNEVKKIVLKDNIRQNIELKTSNINIREVVVKSERSIVEKTQTSVIDLPVNQIKSIPSLLGEVDVLKAVQLLPGVQSNEGFSGFYVRGGGPDQNLILLDGVPVYNVSHIGGLFSVFNADAIKTVRLTKGGFPARFGGRLSSVLEIDMKEGNIKEFKGDATIGLVASKLMLEGPIVKNKTSFIVAGRRTYVDLFVKPFMPASTDLTLYFYDLNAKINHKISKNDRLYLSAYLGRDDFGVLYDENKADNGNSVNSDEGTMSFGLNYGNLTSTLRWNHLFSNRLFSNTTLTFSRYNFNTDFNINENSDNSSTELDLNYLSGVRDLGGRIDFDYTPNPYNDIKFGIFYTFHHFFPGDTELKIDTNSNTLIDTTFSFSDKIDAHELFLYIEDNVKITNKLKANIGLHFGYYSIANTTSSINTSLIDKIKDTENIDLQPRISARYLLNDQWSLKASYAKMKQNIHLLSNSSVGFPSDIWVPATKNVPSQTSEQWALNISTEIYNNQYELSLESYYKTMDQLITYKEGYSNLESTESWEEAVETNGEGRSYGAELFLQKKEGKTTGWIGYTMSWSERKFNNINFSNWYPYKYDRRHDLSIVFMHKFNAKWDIGATCVYSTGNAITFPQAIYLGLPVVDPLSGETTINYVESYGEKNSTRLPFYNRFDFAVNKHSNKDAFQSTWTLAIYNLYNRKNPWFAYLAYENNQRVAKQVSLFPIIPSISYRIKF